MYQILRHIRFKFYMKRLKWIPRIYPLRPQGQASNQPNPSLSIAPCKTTAACLVEHAKAEAADGLLLALRQGRLEHYRARFEHAKGHGRHHRVGCSSNVL